MTKIAFIDKIVREIDVEDESIMDKKRLEYNKALIVRLSEVGTVKSYHELSKYTINRLVTDCENDNPYDVVITHVPFYMPIFGRKNPQYAASLNFLEIVKQDNPDVMLIAYTGAGIGMLPDEKLKEKGASHIMRRQSLYQDYELQQTIDQIVGWVQNES